MGVKITETKAAVDCLWKCYQVSFDFHISVQGIRNQFRNFETPPFRPHFINFSKKFSYKINLVLQCSHLEVLLLIQILAWKGGFQLLHILSLLGKYVFWYCGSTYLSIFQIGSGHTVFAFVCLALSCFLPVIKSFFQYVCKLFLTSESRIPLELS